MYSQQSLNQLKQAYKKQQEDREKRRTSAKIRRTKKRFTKTIEQLSSFGINPSDLLPQQTLPVTSTKEKMEKPIHYKPKNQRKNKNTAENMEIDENFLKFIQAQQRAAATKQKQKVYEPESEDDESEEETMSYTPKTRTTAPKFKKGSQEARDYMQYIRSFRR